MSQKNIIKKLGTSSVYVLRYELRKLQENWVLPSNIDLNDDIIMNIAIASDLDTINHLCLASKQFNQVICNNEHFWKNKYIYDYGMTNMITTSWKKSYQDYGTVIGFGTNEDNQLGLPYDEYNCPPTTLDFKAKFIACGFDFTLLIDLQDQVWGFGDSNDKSISKPTLLNINTGFKKKTNSVIAKARFTACGGYHFMLIDLNDDVWAFGNNNFGQLGLSNVAHSYTPLSSIGIKAKVIACGEAHTIIVDLSNAVWVCGNNNFGQLGLKDNDDVFIPVKIGLYAKHISCGRDWTVIIDLNDEVWVFGNNTEGQLGLGDNVDRNTPTSVGFKAKYVSCGAYHTILIDLNNDLWVFGNNDEGQLGLGNTDDRNIPTMLGMKAKFVACGISYTLVVDLNNDVWGFGDNKNGQLGIEENYSYVPILINMKARLCFCGADYSLLLL
jgi:alpha-tubulin suppressor-like RCC1 family protein